MSVLTIGISDMKVAKPPDTLVTYALGSCVGICLLDPVSHVGGLSHIMLPEASIAPGDKSSAKYADSAIPELLRQMETRGAIRSRVKAKIAGGAQMFQIQSGGNGNSNPMWQIGQRNVAAVKAMLQRLSIQLLAQDVLLDYGRTVYFDPATGIMTVKAINKPSKEL